MEIIGNLLMFIKNKLKIKFCYVFFTIIFKDHFNGVSLVLACFNSKEKNYFENNYYK